MNHSWNHDPFQGGGPVPHRPKKQRRPIGTPVGRTLLNLAVTLVFGAIYFYVTLPPLNLHSGDFYVFVLLTAALLSPLMISFPRIVFSVPCSISYTLASSVR